MTEYFNLQPVFEGKHMQFYCFPAKADGFPVYERSKDIDRTFNEKEITEILHKDGFTRWVKNRKGCPTHVVQTRWHSFYVTKKDCQPPAGIQFVDQREKNYSTLFAWMLIKVPQIPKIFNKEDGYWLVENDYVCNNNKIPSNLLLTITLKELEMIDELGLTVCPYTYRWDEKKLKAAIDGPIPTPLWVQLDSVRSINFRQDIPSCFLMDTVPIYIDLKTDDKTHYFQQDEHGHYWWVEKAKTLDKETAERELNIESPIELVKEENCVLSLFIPLSNVKKVADGEVLKTFYSKQKNNYLVKVRNAKDDCPYKSLTLREPYLIPSLSKEPRCWVVNQPEDAKALGLVPLKAGQRTKNHVTYHLIWVENGKVVKHPKLFGEEDQIYSIRTTKKVKQEYEQLKLKHKLTEPIYQWSIEDLLEYDRLVSNEAYHKEHYLNIEGRLFKAPDYFKQVCEWEKRTFFSKTGKLYVTVYKTLDWLESISMVRNYEQGVKERLVIAMTQAAAHGLPIELVFEHLAKKLGFSEVEIMNTLSKWHSANN